MVWEEKKNNRIGHETKREKWDFAREVPQGEKQQGLGLLYKAFVKRTNQGKIVRLWFMLWSEEKEKGVAAMWI